MSVQDLTNTTWTFNNIISNSDSNFNITFVSNEQTFSILNFEEQDDDVVYFQDGTDDLCYGWTLSYYAASPGNYSTPAVYDGLFRDEWRISTQAYRTIQITGGTDVTNADLISWLEANAVQASSWPTVSIDLTALSGWPTVFSGEHTLTIKAMAEGYRDSNPSTGVTFTKEGNANVIFNVACRMDGTDGGRFTFLYSTDNTNWTSWESAMSDNETVFDIIELTSTTGHIYFKSPREVGLGMHTVDSAQYNTSTVSMPEYPSYNSGTNWNDLIQPTVPYVDLTVPGDGVRYIALYIEFVY